MKLANLFADSIIVLSVILTVAYIVYLALIAV